MIGFRGMSFVEGLLRCVFHVTHSMWWCKWFAQSFANTHFLRYLSSCFVFPMNGIQTNFMHQEGKKTYLISELEKVLSSFPVSVSVQIFLVC